MARGVATPLSLLFLGNPSCLDLEEPLGFAHVVAAQSWYKGVDAVLLD
jgi:hypothetical protein